MTGDDETTATDGGERASDESDIIEEFAAGQRSGVDGGAATTDPSDVDLTEYEPNPKRAYDDSFIDGLLKFVGGLAFPLSQRIADPEGFWVRDTRKLRRNLASANINKTVEGYYASAVGLSLLFAVVFGFTMAGVGVLLFDVSAVLIPLLPDLPFGAIDLTNPYFVWFIGGMLGSVGGLALSVIPLAAAYYYPVAVKRRRAREIGKGFAPGVAFMYALSVSGEEILATISSLADADETFGEISVEMQRIAEKMEVFGVDHRKAIKDVAESTPNDDLADFLTDLQGLIETGGDVTVFLNNQQEAALESSMADQRREIETMEIFGQAYITLSMLPLFFLIIGTIMALLGSLGALPMYAIVYLLIPGLDLLYIVMLSTVKSSAVGEGMISPTRATESNSELLSGDERYLRLSPSEVLKNPTQGLLSTVFTTKLTEKFYAERPSLFTDIRREEVVLRMQRLWVNKWDLFRRRPWLTGVFSVPMTIAILAIGITQGYFSTDPSVVIDRELLHTGAYVYLPILLILTPITLAYEYDRKQRYDVLGDLKETLQKLASANDTGQTLVEAMERTDKDKDERLANEFGNIARRVRYGWSMDAAIVNFVNKYRVPRLARTMVLVQKAQETADYIADVLNTASRLAKNEDKIEKERRSAVREQLVIIALAYVVFAGIMVGLAGTFLGTLAGLFNSGGGGISQSGPLGSSSLEQSVLEALFLHAVTIKAITTGIVTGYAQTTNLRDSMKYVVVFMLIGLAMWALAGVVL